MAEGLLMFVRLDDPPEVRLETVGLPDLPRRRGAPGGGGRAGCARRRDRGAAGRGPYTLRGYYNAARAQSSGPFTPDGFYRSGDLLSGGTERQLRGRGPEQGPDQPGRGEDLRGGGREPHPVPPGRAQRGVRSGSRSRARRAHVRLRDPASAGRPDPAGSGGVPHRRRRSPGTSCPNGWRSPSFAAVPLSARSSRRIWPPWLRLIRGTSTNEAGGPACLPGHGGVDRVAGAYVEPLGRYWKKEWTARREEEVVADFRAHGIEAVLVAFDIESVTGAPPCTSAYVAGLRDRHPGDVRRRMGDGGPACAASRRSPTRGAQCRAPGARLPLPPDHGALLGGRPEVPPAVRRDQRPRRAGAWSTSAPPAWGRICRAARGAARGTPTRRRSTRSRPRSRPDRRRRPSRLALGGGDDRGRAAQGQRVLGAVRWAPKHFPPSLQTDIRGPPPGQDHVRHGLPEPAAEPAAAGMGRVWGSAPRSCTRCSTPTPSASCMPAHGAQRGGRPAGRWAGVRAAGRRRRARPRRQEAAMTGRPGGPGDRGGARIGRAAALALGLPRLRRGDQLLGQRGGGAAGGAGGPGGRRQRPGGREADVADETAVRHMVATAGDTYGRIDAPINNARR